MIPAPLTPADCEIRDYPRMMIDIMRLRQSSFDAIISDAAWRAGLNLWFAAWHAIPAGSVDPDEGALAKQAGLGRDVTTWRAVATDALRGFVECSDGRLYHRTVCEFALEAWIGKLIQRLVSASGNATRHRQAAFDPAPRLAQLAEAAKLLENLAPGAKAIAKARRSLSQWEAKQVPSGADDVPDGIQPGSQQDAQTVPTGSQGKGKGKGEVIITDVIIADDVREREREALIEQTAAKACELANLDNGDAWRERNESQIAEWIAEGFDPADHILAGVELRMLTAVADGAVVTSLRYCDPAVRKLLALQLAGQADSGAEYVAGVRAAQSNRRPARTAAGTGARTC